MSCLVPLVDTRLGRFLEVSISGDGVAVDREKIGRGLVGVSWVNMGIQVKVSTISCVGQIEVRKVKRVGDIHARVVRLPAAVFPPLLPFNGPLFSLFFDFLVD
jgi:hypothetical protein